MVEGKNRERDRERRRRKGKRKEERPGAGSVRIAGSEGKGLSKKESKVASYKREQNHESCGTRNRRRTNGGSLSSRGSATSIQCGLCAVLTGLFRRAMCIAGSRRGSGESCYQELSTDIHPAALPATNDSLCAGNDPEDPAGRQASFSRIKEAVEEVIFDVYYYFMLLNQFLEKNNYYSQRIRDRKKLIRIFFVDN